MHTRFLVIGAGLSGLAAAIRLARFHDDVLLVEKHFRIGGLNSYFYRNNHLFETGLHAITNFAPRSEKKAPLNRLLRQLKINRDEIGFCEQKKSEIRYSSELSLVFSNNFEEFIEEVCSKFSTQSDGFHRLVAFIGECDPFQPSAYQSSRRILEGFIKDSVLIDMILCPLLYYGSSWEDDIDFSQFVIMFRSIFQEGLFRPSGTIKDFLELLVDKLGSFGGKIRLNTAVEQISHDSKKVYGVTLANGERITCDYLISTAGVDETNILLGDTAVPNPGQRIGFIENIYQLKREKQNQLPDDRSCIFYYNSDRFSYRIPDKEADFTSGVICLPFNFSPSQPDKTHIEVRSTHLANYKTWQHLAMDRDAYTKCKERVALTSAQTIEHIIGSFYKDVTYQDTFTPLTIKRFTGKIGGAIYGSPTKTKDGTTKYENLFLAGTDQGFLGIVGSMLSGVSMVNRNLLTRS